MRSRTAQLWLLFAIMAVCIVGVTSVGALAVPPAPTDVPILDQTGTLDDSQKASLAEQIATEREKSGNQIAIVVIPSLDGEAIEEYSLSIARSWGIGTDTNDNGVLLLVVKDDRQLRIEVGTGLEGALTDAQSNRIIRNDITPLFREGKYYEGIQAGLGGIIAAIHGEYVSSDTEQARPGSFPWEFIIAFGFFGLAWLGSILARTKSWWAGGVIGAAGGALTGFIMGSLVVGFIGVGVLAIVGLLFDKVVSDNYRSHARSGNRPSWWAGGGFLGGGGPRGGGGFGGFGGGGFGGGGSSGGW